MAELIDRARAIAVAAEKKKRKEKAQKKLEEYQALKKQNDKLAQAHIARLPDEISAAAAEGRRYLYLYFAERNFFDAIIQVEKWCEKGGFATRRSEEDDPNDGSKVQCLEISWPDKPSGK